MSSDTAILAALDNETIINLFRHACETGNDAAADALETEIGKRGIYGRKQDQTTLRASSGPGVVPSLVAEPNPDQPDARILREPRP